MIKRLCDQWHSKQPMDKRYPEFNRYQWYVLYGRNDIHYYQIWDS